MHNLVAGGPPKRMDIQRKLLDVYLTACSSKRADNKSKRQGLSTTSYARLRDLSRQAYEDFLTTASKTVCISDRTEEFAVRFKKPLIESTLARFWEIDKEGDDITLLILFNAPRPVIQQITGVHSTELTQRRKVLSVPKPRGRDRDLKPHELLQIIRMWRDLITLRTTRRLIAVHALTGFNIGQIWRGLEQMKEPTGDSDPTPQRVA